MEKALSTSNNNVKSKEKRRSNEKRKEKSRDAARCRRSRETEIFLELGHVLPLRKGDVEQLDKASIMRLSIAYLKVREMLKLLPKLNTISLEAKVRKQNKEKDRLDLVNNAGNRTLLTQALDGFLMILSGDGDVTYVSENISEFLGISQIDILGQQIWEYSHQCDHEELKEALTIKRSETSTEDDALTTKYRAIFVRLKCTLTSRGRSVNIKSASYKVIHVTGHMVMNGNGTRYLIAIGRPLPHPSNIEIPLESTTFFTKHSLDMKFTYVDDKMLSLLGYYPEDLLGKSLYDCHHAEDSGSLMTTFKYVLSKGQGETCRYRFLGKLGGYCWILTQATIVYDKEKPQSVVCVNYVVSEIENNNEIYSCAQLEASRKESEVTKISNKQSEQEKDQQEESAEEIKEKSGSLLQLKRQQKNSNVIIKRDINKHCRENSLSPIRRTLNNCTISSKSPVLERKLSEKRPKSVTASVFTHVRVPDKNILLSNNFVSGNCAISKAAQSVTASVFTPISNLSNHIPVIGSQKVSTQSRTEEMNKGYLSYADDCSNLPMLKEEPDDLTHLAPTAGDACISLDESTPLFGEMLEGLILPESYGLLPDDINSLDSQQSSCNNSKTQVDPFINYREESSDTNSSPHLLSPSGVSKSPEASSIPSLCSPNSMSQEDEFAFMTMNVEDDIDLTMRAPYIPMNEQEDLPLLTDDLMWSAFTEELHKDMKETLQVDGIKNDTNDTNIADTNNSNVLNSKDPINESSLANLLCANSVRQEDEFPNQTIEKNKKRRFEKINTNMNENQLVGTYGENISKNSDTECWTMNDMLQLNSMRSSSTPSMQYDIRLEKKNTLVNKATLTTSQVSFTTVQNHKNNIYLKSALNLLSSDSSDKCDDDNGSIKQELTPKPLLATSFSVLKNTISGNNNLDLNNSAACNKRHLNVAASLDTKRVKNSPSVEIQTSPQLLQQLMAPTPQRQQTKLTLDKSHVTQWCSDGDERQKNIDLSTTSSSNSVLKNLLVSGCDGLRSSLPVNIVLKDGTETGSLQNPQVHSYPSYARYLRRPTSILHSLGSNPLIGGVEVQISPTVSIAEDSLPPSLISIHDSDTGSDSGIEDSSLDPGGKIDIPSKLDLEISEEDPPPLEANNSAYLFTITDNPLYSPFLRELRSDDYSMEEPIGTDILQSNDITEAFGDWSSEMT